MVFLRSSLFFATLALTAAWSPCAAQFTQEDFALTQCGRREPLFRAGFESAETAAARPSGGGGGAAPGAQALAVSVPDALRTHQVLVWVPQNYDPAQSWPLVVALHGSPGSQAQAPAAAAAMRTLWSGVSGQQGVIVLAPIASGMQGGWVPSYDTPALACAIATVERAYNIDRTRRYLWGFSAGGHYGHAVALANSTRLAAYAVNAGALHALACAPSGASSCGTLLPAVARRIPVLLRVGTSDPLKNYVVGDVDRFEAAGWMLGAGLDFAQFSGGHTVSAADAAAAWSSFQNRRLVP